MNRNLRFWMILVIVPFFSACKGATLSGPAAATTGGSFVLGNILGYITPAYWWLTPFAIGWFWLLIRNKEIRGHAHWATYTTPPICFFFIIARGLNLIPGMPLIGTLVNGYKKVMDFKIRDYTIRELTVGAIGCAIITGVAGGNWATQFIPWVVAFIIIGLVGWFYFILDLLTKFGVAEQAVKEAPGKWALKLWRKVFPKTWKCPNCGSKDNPIDEKTGAMDDRCVKCGAINPHPRPWKCACKVDNIKGAEFCKACGKPRLGTQANTPPPPASASAGGAGNQAQPPAGTPPGGQAPPPAQAAGKVCPRCQHQNDPQARFCEDCAISLVPQGSPAAHSQTTATAPAPAAAPQRRTAAARRRF